MAGGGEVRGDIVGIGGNGDRICEVHLLPAGSRFSYEGCGRQLAASGRPQVADMSAGVSRTLIEANALDGPRNIRAELDTKLDCAGVLRCPEGFRKGGGAPDRVIGGR